MNDKAQTTEYQLIINLTYSISVIFALVYFKFPKILRG